MADSEQQGTLVKFITLSTAQESISKVLEASERDNTKAAFKYYAFNGDVSKLKAPKVTASNINNGQSNSTRLLSIPQMQQQTQSQQDASQQSLFHMAPPSHSLFDSFMLYPVK